MNYPTCGEISCEECNYRYEKAMKRIAELEAMVRELVQCCQYEEPECPTCRKALALLSKHAPTDK